MRQYKNKVPIKVFLIILLVITLCLNLFIKYSHPPTNESFISYKIIERDEFDTYIINLKKNKDRLDAITSEYNASDLSDVPFIRFDAVNGKEIDVRPYVSERVYNGIKDIENNNGERYHHSQITRGAVGCYLSHIHIYEKIKASKKPFALVIEDDAMINKEIYTNGIRNIHHLIPADWDIILLGKIDRDVINHTTYFEMREFWGTHGYLINQSGVNKMLQYGNIPIDDQIDAVMGKLARADTLHIYAPTVQYIPANTSFGSEIQKPITPKEGINPDEDPHAI